MFDFIYEHFNFDLFGQFCAVLAVVFGIGYLLRYINDRWFGGKEYRKYEKEKEKRWFWRKWGS